MTTFAIIGAGWYGCHIALSLKALGFDVTVFERHSRPFHEASGNNQFRLHQGFHYPRHAGTRLQSRDGYMRFIERYPDLSLPVARNIYAVPEHDSLIDLTTYRLIMTASGLQYRPIEHPPVPLKDISGCLMVDERLLLIDRARQYFSRELGTDLHLSEAEERITPKARCVWVNGERFDFLIDASWGRATPLHRKVFFEPTMLLYYEAMDPHFPALTFVDGPLCSVYPTEDETTFTLSSVPHTPLGPTRNPAEAYAAVQQVSEALVMQKARLMEQQITRYLPDFHQHFRLIGPQLAVKTKPVGSHDDRSCYVHRQDRVFSVLSGKIDTIFFAADQIIAAIQSEGREAPRPSSTLRSEIASVFEVEALA